MTEKVKVAISGINGKMGRASLAAIIQDDRLELCAVIGRPGAEYIGKKLQELPGLADCHYGNLSVDDSLELILDKHEIDVLLDFTIADSATRYAEIALSRNVAVVIGTSGMEPELLERISIAAEKSSAGAMVVPNFSIGAVLMMQFAASAARYFDNIEIVEMHHDRKVDAPSGTAMHTVRRLAALEKSFNPARVEEKEILPGARGARAESGVRVHSLRLPGLISHQDVICGSDGELLTIRHDSFNTNCFAKGIIMSIKAVTDMSGLVVGLDSLL